MTKKKSSNHFTLTDANELFLRPPTENFILRAGVLAKVRNNGGMNVLSLSLPQAAKVLGVSLDTLNQLCRKKLLRSFHIGRRHFVSVDAIKEFIKDQEEAEQW